jgi:hypothetical protein
MMCAERRTILALLVTLFLAGCQTDSESGPKLASAAAIPDAVAFEQAKKAVTAALKDPDSARFDKLQRRTTSNLDLVCGKVNGKNSFGGYTGSKLFAFNVTTNEPAMLAEEGALPNWQLSALFICTHPYIS